MVLFADKHRARGWFPRRCAVEIFENGDVATDIIQSVNEDDITEKKEN